MSFIYIAEYGVTIGASDGRLEISKEKVIIKTVPLGTVEGMVILGKAQLTTQCMEYCLINGISVSFFSKGGKYFGRLKSTAHVNTKRQKLQCYLSDSEFALSIAKSIITAKLHNQYIVLKRYERSNNITYSQSDKMINICRNKVYTAASINEIMGYEGNGAKYYFKGLSECVEKDFKFTSRNKRPPKDPFNSMLSLGYTILHNEVYCIVEQKGLNPYFGFIHSDSERNPSLVSDLIEEWRAVIVDATVMSLINGHEIKIEHFTQGTQDEGCYLTKEGLNIFLRKISNKLETKIKYIKSYDAEVSFRYAISLQLDLLIKAMQEKKPNLYKALWIR